MNPVTFRPIPDWFEPKTDDERKRDDWRFAIDAFNLAVLYDLERKFEEAAVHLAIAKIDQARRVDPYLTDAQLEHVAQRAVVEFLARVAPLSLPAVAPAPVPIIASDAPAPAPKAHVLDGVTLGRGVDWREPGGLLGHMADWIMETSRRPNRSLAVASSVAVLSTLCGRHLYGPTGTALNLYIAAIAETSVGKDRPFKATYELLKSAGFEYLHQTMRCSQFRASNN